MNPAHVACGGFPTDTQNALMYTASYIHALSTQEGGYMHATNLYYCYYYYVVVRAKIKSIVYNKPVTITML